MKRLRITGIVLAIIAFALLGLILALRPPALEVPAPGVYMLHDVTLIQPGEFVREHQDISVRDGRIVAIEPAGQSTAGDVEPVARGGHVLPGLIDLHVHHPPRLAAGQRELWSLLYIAHGVTGVRDIGDIDGTLSEFKREIAAGRVVGPAVTRCGVILDGDPPSFPSNFRVNTPEEARAKVRALKGEGVDCIKVYTMLKRDVLRAIQAEATAVDLPVLGHLPHSVTLEESNLKEVQHFMGIPIVDYEKAGLNESSLSDWATLGDERINRQIEVSRRLGIEHLPTLFNLVRREWILDDGGWMNDSALRHMPRFWSLSWRTLWGPPYKGEREREQRRIMVARMLEILKRMHARGVTVHLGTDTLMPFVAPGSSLHGEIRIFVDAGLPVEDVLALATTHAGTHMNPPTGRLAVGYPADLLVFQKNPLADLELLRRPETVVARGRLYHRDRLDRSLAAYDEHFLEGLYPALMDFLALGIQELFRRR